MELASIVVLSVCGFAFTIGVICTYMDVREEQEQFGLLNSKDIEDITEKEYLSFRATVKRAYHERMSARDMFKGRK